MCEAPAGSVRLAVKATTGKTALTSLPRGKSSLRAASSSRRYAVSQKLVLIERHNVGRLDMFYTTPLFWDCECEENYIHSFTEENCPACGATCEEAPDARVHEVIGHSIGLNSTLVAALEVVCGEVCPNLAPIPF